MSAGKIIFCCIFVNSFMISTSDWIPDIAGFESYDKGS
jgi:hypothetical protein